MMTLNGIDNVMKDFRVNNDASNYIVNNYEKVINAVRSMKVDHDKAIDLVHDVYISLLKSEANGDGYDEESYGVNGIEHFVFGRLKGYSKNKKYHSNSFIVDEVSSSFDGNLENANSYQQAYNNAASYDDIAIVESELDINEEILFLLSFENSTFISIKELLRNLLGIMESKLSFSNSVFAELREQGEAFNESLKEIVTYAGMRPDNYSEILAGII